MENVGRIFERQESFLKENAKGELAWGAYYVRVLIYLLSGMQRYFGNEENPKSKRESYKEFKRLLKTEPYKTAIRKSSLKYIGARKLWVTTFLLKFRLYYLYWILSMR